MSKPLPPLTPAELSSLVSVSPAPRLLDVREPHEFVSELGHVQGSELVPLGSLPAQLARFSGETREIIIICRSGMRAGQAADFLAKQGLKARVLAGGMLAWNQAQLPISRDAG
jgi:hydroxyacylglutathione hydrolase